MKSKDQEQEALELEHPFYDDEEIDLTTPKNRTIYTDKSEPEIDALHKKHKKGKLDIQPDFQRRFLWDSKRCSRLIESALFKYSSTYSILITRGRWNRICYRWATMANSIFFLYRWQISRW